MTEFLMGIPLSKKIKEIMAGANPRMSVAFLGPNWTKEIFGRTAPDNLRVICDLAMNMTPKPALETAGAPDNENLRHLPGVEMHGKVYLSDAGAVVCSANATKAALSPTNRFEDGVWLEPASRAFEQVVEMFEKRFKESGKIGQKELDAAPLRVTESQRNIDGHTIVEALKGNIGAFDGVYFVCSTKEVKPNVRNAANAEIEAKAENVGGNKADRRDYFHNWEVLENDWPALFFAIHWGPGGDFSVTKHRHDQLVTTPEIGKVYVSHKLDWKTAGAAFGGLPPLAEKIQCANELEALIGSRRNLMAFAGKILDGQKFLELLTKQE